jgi:uncharacterized phage infection (PIP) family protein YhgE
MEFAGGIDIEQSSVERDVISMDRISQELSDPVTAHSFRNTYNTWKKDIYSEILTDEVLNKIFDKKRATYFKIFGVLGLIIAITIFISTIYQLPATSIVVLSSVLFGLVVIVSLILPQRVEGQWTTYGRNIIINGIILRSTSKISA